MPCGFAQELVTLDMEDKKMRNLGEINKRAVVSLDVENLLGVVGKKEEKPKGGQGTNGKEAGGEGRQRGQRSGQGGKPLNF
jgi:hypothetical protein